MIITFRKTYFRKSYLPMNSHFIGQRIAGNRPYRLTAAAPVTGKSLPTIIKYSKFGYAIQQA